MKVQRFDDGVLAIGWLALMAPVLLTPSRAALDALVVSSLAGGVLLLWLAMGLRLPARWPMHRALSIFTLLRLGVLMAVSKAILISADGGQVVDAFGAFATHHGVLAGWLKLTAIGAIQLTIIAAALRRVNDLAVRLPPALAAKYLDVLKLIRSEAIAATVIVLVNLAAGMVIGVDQYNLPATQALHMISALAFGMAIASQLPSILCTMAAGLIVTRLADGGSPPGSAASA